MIDVRNLGILARDDAAAEQVRRLIRAGQEALGEEPDLVQLLLMEPGYRRVRLRAIGDDSLVLQRTQRLVALPKNQVDLDVQTLLDRVVDLLKRQHKDQRALEELETGVPDREKKLQLKRAELTYALSQLEVGRFAVAVQKGGVRIVYNGGEDRQYHLNDAKGAKVGTFYDQGRAQLLAGQQQILDALAKEVEGKKEAIETFQAQAEPLADMIEAAKGRAADAVKKMLHGTIEDSEFVVVSNAQSWEILLVSVEDKYVFCSPVDKESFIEATLAQEEFVKNALAQEGFVKNALGAKELCRSAFEEESLVRTALQKGAITLSPELATVLRRLFGEYDLPRLEGMKGLMAAVLDNGKPKEAGTKDVSKSPSKSAVAMTS